jgi:SulP family sulfate permease
MDVSAAMAVDTIASDTKAAGKLLYICGANQAVKDVLLAINGGELAHFESETLIEALQKAVKVIDSDSDGNTTGSSQPIVN